MSINLTNKQIPITDNNPLIPPKKPSSAPKILVIVFCVVLFFGLLIATPFAIAYMPETFSFVPINIRLSINSVLAKLPVPRNLDQVLMSIYNSSQNTNLTTYTQKAFIEGTVSGVNSVLDIDAVRFGFRMDGPIDLSVPSSPKVNQTISLYASYGASLPFQSQIELTSLDNKIYANIKSFPEMVYQMLGLPIAYNDLVNQWYVMDLSAYVPQDSFSFENTPSVSWQTDFETKLTPLSEKFINNFLPKHDYHQYIKPAGEEAINNLQTYKIQFNKSGTELIPVVSDLIAFMNEELPSITADYTPITDTEITEIEKALGYVDSMDLSVWVDKNRFIPIRLTYSLKTTIPSEELSSGDLGFSGFGMLTPNAIGMDFNIGWEISKLNEAQNIVAPTDAQPLEDIIGQLMLNNINSSQDSTIRSDMAQIQTGLELYAIDNNQYPDRLITLSLNDYLSSVPTTPYGMDYDYVTNGTDYFLYTRLTNPTEFDKEYYTVSNLDSFPQELSFLQLQEYISQISDTPIIPDYSIQNQQVFGDFDYNYKALIRTIFGLKNN